MQQSRSSLLKTYLNSTQWNSKNLPSWSITRRHPQYGHLQLLSLSKRPSSSAACPRKVVDQNQTTKTRKTTLGVLLSASSKTLSTIVVSLLRHPRQMQSLPRAHDPQPDHLQHIKPHGYQSAAVDHLSAVTERTFSRLRLPSTVPHPAMKPSQITKRRSRVLVDSCAVSHLFPVLAARLHLPLSSHQQCMKRWPSLSALQPQALLLLSHTWEMSMCSSLTISSGSDATCVWIPRVSSS